MTGPNVSTIFVVFLLLNPQFVQIERFFIILRQIWLTLMDAVEKF